MNESAKIVTFLNEMIKAGTDRVYLTQGEFGAFTDSYQYGQYFKHRLAGISGKHIGQYKNLLIYIEEGEDSSVNSI